LIKYQPGGGHWSWFLQYPLGLRALGHEVLWLELLQSSGHRETDLHVIRDFFERLAVYDLGRNCAVLLNRDLYPGSFEASEAFGGDKEHLNGFIKTTELLLNFCCAFGQPLLSLFKRRALLDFDPGHLHLTASTADLNVRDHEVFLTIGARINEPDSEIPTPGPGVAHVRALRFSANVASRPRSWPPGVVQLDYAMDVGAAAMARANVQRFEA
jgi:hypothetical protein